MGIKLGFKIFFEKLPSLGGVLAMSKNCNGPEKRIKLVPLLVKENIKNPAYRRHQLSRPMCKGVELA